MNPPQKPFDTYKWRWATLLPTESLNEPPVFLGALRVFAKFENEAPSSVDVLDALGVVQEQTNPTVDLVRTPDRNLIRNSGQYWKGMGLLESAHGRISLTPFGRALASGSMSQIEFALTMVRTLELPNRRIQSDSSLWDSAGIRIQPLFLVLQIVADLAEQLGESNKYITPDELIKIVIPLAGDSRTTASNYVEAIQQHRLGELDLRDWPDCAPASNDRRMAREFLLFLSNYGLLTRADVGQGNYGERYVLENLEIAEILELGNTSITEDYLSNEQVISRTQVPASVERRRVLREVLSRPNQTGFRKSILDGYNSTCLLTGVKIESVLEAAHIIPVRSDGTDSLDNGICLRVDIHRLFDSNHLRIDATGNLLLSDLARRDDDYGFLPHTVTLPDFIDRAKLNWRLNYH